MAWQSKEYVNKAQGSAGVDVPASTATVVSHTFSPRNAESFVVTIKHSTGTAATVDIQDSSDNFATWDSVLSASIDDTETVTVIRVSDAGGADVPVRSVLRVSVTATDAMTIDSVVVDSFGGC